MTTPATSAASPTPPDPLDSSESRFYHEALRFTLLACSYYHADPSNLPDFRDPPCNAVRCLVTHALRHHTPPFVTWPTLTRLFRLYSYFSLAPFAPRGILNTLRKHPELTDIINADFQTLTSITATFQPLTPASLELLHATLHRRTPPTLHPALSNSHSRTSRDNPRIIANARTRLIQPRQSHQPQRPHHP